ncbi:CALCA [Cervus elaphus hippelaphus]|uniref:CALCA n=1 Tax=Cervus elaphus hippelaphus TaxID=46360 RepID=A0A212DJ61_CEREH|nr:CALCA [Cervus elaphus hippelaphus]
MGFGKSSPFLAFSILVLCQAGSLQATPLRSALETLPDPGALSEKEGRLLLAALVKAYVQRKTNELEQEEEQETEDSSLDGSRAKRCSNLSTCVLSAYWKDLNNYHRFSGMGFGPETPGKKRDVANGLERDRSSHFGKRSCNTATCVTHRLAGLLSRSGGMVKSNFVPTNVGSEAFGRRRRDLQD